LRRKDQRNTTRDDFSRALSNRKPTLSQRKQARMVLGLFFNLTVFLCLISRRAFFISVLTQLATW
jgi:hypothetical protein